MRAKVEHPIGIIKRVFGFAKVRYRGFKKNAHRLVGTCALANLFIPRRHLLRCDVAYPVWLNYHRLQTPQTPHQQPQTPPQGNANPAPEDSNPLKVPVPGLPNGPAPAPAPQGK